MDQDLLEADTSTKADSWMLVPRVSTLVRVTVHVVELLKTSPHKGNMHVTGEESLKHLLNLWYH